MTKKNIFDNIEDITSGAMDFSFIVAKDTKLPMIGDTLKDKGMFICITEVNEENRKVRCLVKKDTSKESLVDFFADRSEKAVSKVAYFLYLMNNKDKMAALIEWGDVDKEVKANYTYMAKNIFEIFSDFGLTAIEAKDLFDSDK